MCTRSRFGFNVIGLAAMTVAVMLLVLALIPAMSCGVWSANVCAVGCRGRDIYVSIMGANMEREPLGLPSVWPSEGIPPTNAVDDIASVIFSNSTDYFNALLDGKNLGTERWNPFVAGFGYSKLAGAGVAACSNGRLTPENNMWTVAMNVRDEMEDVVPVLVTRNVDASSLAEKITGPDWNKSLRFDPEWETPFGNKGFVMIRKGGAIFKARAKYMSYGIVYCKQTFDATVDKDGKPAARPLTYLTPTRAVVPGGRAYADGAARVARLSGDRLKRLRRALAAVASMALPVGACVAVVYLLIAGLCGARRYRQRVKPCLSAYAVGLGLFHCAAVTLWLCAIMGSAFWEGTEYRGMLLALAVLAQLAGIAFVCVCRRGDGAARERGIKWMVAAPLTILGLLALVIVAGLVASLYG